MNRDVEKDSRHPPSLVELWRTGPSSTEGHLKETCHSTKRTHFVFAYFLVYHISLQEFTSFAGAFANGFVLEKRTHFWGCFGVGFGRDFTGAGRLRRGH